MIEGKTQQFAEEVSLIQSLSKAPSSS